MRENRVAPRQAMLVATVALVGLNLRPFMTSIGPLAGTIRVQTGLGLQGMALLTLVPMLLMGVLAFAGPVLASAAGARRSILLALLVVCGGCALRMVAGSGWALVATAALIGLGVAIIQAVFPGIIKREFAGHVGPMMGLYSAMLMGGGALGAVLSPAVSEATGSWTAGLGCFALSALAALLLAAVALPAEAHARPVSRMTRAFLARSRTWLLMVCFGLVNGGYASVVAWLAPAYQEQGWSVSASAGLLATVALSQALAALALPILARKQLDRRPWLWFTLAMQALGFTGLILAPGLAPHLLAAVLGAGLGAWFALSLVLALDHLPDPAQAGALTALMQGGGFVLAALPPWLVAVLHDLTGSYLAGWSWHLACIGLVAVLTARLEPGSYAAAMPALSAQAHSPAPVRARCSSRAAQ